MEAIAEFTASCRHGLHGLASLPASLPVALLLAAFAGSLVHCVGMCGPFVLGQVIADSERTRGGYGEWQRLSGAALLPYHLGRLTTYTALGTAAGAMTAVFAATTDFAALSAVLLVLAAVAMMLQSLGLALGPRLPLSATVTGWATSLSRSREPVARYAFGAVLGLLPCGLVYAALAAAAGTGSPLEGGIAMAAFSLGTLPALVAVGWLGVAVRRRLRSVAQWVAAPLLGANALLLLILAGQRF